MPKIVTPLGNDEGKGVDASAPCTEPMGGRTPSTLENKWVDVVRLRRPTFAPLFLELSNQGRSQDFLKEILFFFFSLRLSA